MLNRKIAPIDFSFTNPEIRSPDIHQLKNGLKVYSTSDHKLDILKIDILFENANSLTESITGLNFITSKSIFSGTSSMSAEAISTKIASLGAFIDISSSFDYSALTVYCLETNVDKTIALISEILDSTKFSKKELELQKKIAISNLQVQEQKNNVIASRSLRKSLYGDHFYGSSPTVSLVNNINQDNVITNYDNKWNVTAIFISGCVTDKAIRSLECLSHVKTIYKDHNQSSIPDIPINKQVVTVKKNSIQTSIRFGKRTIGRKHIDYAHLVLTNYILGGFFGSRLMSNLREQKGLTYGIHSSITTLRSDAFFAIQCDVKSDDKALAIEEIQKELEMLGTKRITNSELLLAKNHYVGSFQNSLSSIYSLSSKHKSAYLYGLKEDYYESLINSIKKISVDDIFNSSKKHLQLENMVLLTVGE